MAEATTDCGAGVAQASSPGAADPIQPVSLERAALSEAACARDLATLRLGLRQAQVALTQGAWHSALQHLDRVLEHELAHLDVAEVMDRARELRARIQRTRRLRANRITLLTVVALSLAVVMIAAVVEMPSVAIEAVLRIDGLRLTPRGPIAITGAGVAGVELGSMERVATAGRFLDTEATPGAAAAQNGEVQPLLLHPTSRAFAVRIEGPGLFVDHLSLEPCADLVVRSLGSPVSRLRVGPACAAVTGELQMGPTIQISANAARVDPGGAPPSTLQMVPEESLVFEGGVGAIVAIERRSTDTQAMLLASELHVSALHVSDPDDPQRSAILDGALRLPDYAVSPLPLAAGDHLWIEPESTLALRNLVWHDALELRVSGRVRAVAVNKHSQMPTMLTWARLHHQVLLVSAALAAMVSFIWLALQRLEIIRS